MSKENLEAFQRGVEAGNFRERDRALEAAGLAE
jgi:hypothetical protein